MAGSVGIAARFRCGDWLTGFQALAALGLVALLAMPPSRGAMLVVPIGGSAQHSLIAGTRLLAAGPFPGSLVVDGDRATLLPHLLRRGTLLLAAPAAFCEGVAA